MRTRRIGLRPRIAIVAAISVGLALTIGASVLLTLLRSRLDGAATTAATLRARDVASLAIGGTLPRRLALPGEESALVQVVDMDGTVIASTANIEGEPAISTRRPTGPAAVAFTAVVVALDDSNDMRIVALRATTAGREVIVYAGESLTRADETVTSIMAALIVGVPALVAVVAGVTWWGVGRTLRPVRAITNTMAEITAHDLHRRVPPAVTNDEIGQLATTVNLTLARLDTSVERQKRFVADASHELRGPLAALRADLEISITHPQRTHWITVANDTLGDVERLQRLTEDLLTLARTDREPSQVDHERVDLADIAMGLVAEVRREDLVVAVHELASPAMLVGDEDQLRKLVRNLMHNSEEHATSRIDVTIDRQHDLIRMTVADDGPGIPVG
ncbi:MAG: Two-component system, sensor histidine kinase, partial [Ilumatobacteraceae bacterium]|nr:Two-component system, sensor histidine kinase [Ilumatobacteraceae bacterium]